MRPLSSGLFPLAAFLLLALLLAPPGAAAQQQEDTTQVLPDIAPREFEIRGQLEISFPALERQPLVGFNPPPRVPPVPEDRRPYVEAYGQELAAAPETLPGRDGPPDLLAHPAPINGEFEAGGGRYFSRFGRARLAFPLSDRETVALRLDYVGADGFTPFENEPRVETPFDTFEGQLGIRVRRSSFQAGVELDGFADTYTLYGADANTPPGAGSDPAPQPGREGRGAGGTFSIETTGPVLARLEARYEETHYETTVYGEDPSGAFRRAEQRLGLSAGLDIPLGNQAILADATFSVAGLDTDGTLERDVLLLDAGAGARLAASPSHELTVGARALVVDNDLLPDAPDEPSVYLSPAVYLAWHPRAQATLYLKNEPGATPNTLADLYRENPFLIHEPVVHPTVRTVDAEAGARLFAGPLQLATRAGYRHLPSYLFFEPAQTREYDRGLFAARYGEARILHAGADVSVRGPHGLQASLGASFRDGHLVEDDTAIPYFAPVTASALFSYPFSERRGLVQLTGTFESVRYLDRDADRQMDAFFDVDASASYNITPSIGVVLHMENLSTGLLERWPGYPQPPLVVMTGLRVRW